jgi:hypothetical protein
MIKDIPKAKRIARKIKATFLIKYRLPAVGSKIEYVCITNKFIETGKMKIKVESEKIIKAVKKLDGIEIVLENLDDAREAINLILLRAGLFEKHKDVEPKEVRVSSYQKYETTAVDYKMIFLLEFIFENDNSLDTRVAVIKELQEFFSKV